MSWLLFGKKDILPREPGGRVAHLLLGDGNWFSLFSTYDKEEFRWSLQTPKHIDPNEEDPLSILFGIDDLRFCPEICDFWEMFMIDDEFYLGCYQDFESMLDCVRNIWKELQTMIDKFKSGYIKSEGRGKEHYFEEKSWVSFCGIMKRTDPNDSSDSPSGDVPLCKKCEKKLKRVGCCNE